MKSETIMAVDDSRGNYCGVLTRKKVFFGFFTRYAYYVEVQSKVSGKRTWRKKIGTKGCAVGDGTNPYRWDTKVSRMNFTDKGLETEICNSGEHLGFLLPFEERSAGKKVVISRKKFPF